MNMHDDTVLSLKIHDLTDLPVRSLFHDALCHSEPVYTASCTCVVSAGYGRVSTEPWRAVARLQWDLGTSTRTSTTSSPLASESSYTGCSDDWKRQFQTLFPMWKEGVDHFPHVALPLASGNAEPQTAVLSLITHALYWSIVEETQW